jgi:hypothetical protein
MIRLLIDDVTLARTDCIHAHVRFRGGQTTSLTLPIPPKAWQLCETHPNTLAMLNRLLDERTHAETAEQLDAAGHHSGEGKTVHRPDRARPTPRAPHAQPHPAAARPRPARHRRTRPTPQRAPNQPSRTSTAPACSSRTRPTTRHPTLRTAPAWRSASRCPARKPTQKSSSHPTRARRWSVKRKPYRSMTRCGPPTAEYRALGCGWRTYRTCIDWAQWIDAAPVCCGESGCCLVLRLCHPAEGLAGSVVEGGCHCFDLLGRPAGQVGALGELLAQQAVRRSYVCQAAAEGVIRLSRIT